MAVGHEQIPSQMPRYFIRMSFYLSPWEGLTLNKFLSTKRVSHSLHNKPPPNLAPVGVHRQISMGSYDNSGF